MAELPRKLAYRDRFVWELEQQLAERFANCDDFVDRYIFPDLTTQVPFVLYLSQQEFTKLYSAVLTGADLTYPLQSHDVEYLLLQMLICPMNELCQAIADCISSSSATQLALDTFLKDGGYGSGGGDGTLPINYNDDPLLIDGSQIAGCDNDNLFGAITQTVDLFNQIIEDAFEAFEASTAPYERISAVLEAVPITNVLALDDLVQFVDQMLENLAQNYTGQYTAALRDEYRCDLFCLSKDTCSMRFSEMADYFLSRVGETFSQTDFADGVNWFIFGSFTGDAVVHAAHAILASVLAYGSKFFNLDNTWLSKAMTSFLNDPDPDWTTLCTCGTGWAYEIDFEVELGLFTVPQGTWTSGIGIVSVVNSFGQQDAQALLTIDASQYQWTRFRIEYERTSSGSFNDDVRVILWTDVVAGTGRYDWAERDDVTTGTLVYCPAPPPPVGPARKQINFLLRDNSAVDTMVIKKIKVWHVSEATPPAPLVENSTPSC